MAEARTADSEPTLSPRTLAALAGEKNVARPLHKRKIKVPSGSSVLRAAVRSSADPTDSSLRDWGAGEGLLPCSS